MQIITKEEFELNVEKYLKEIEEGKVFIYSTDTIYGIGCNAMNSEAVKRIREAKNRSNAPFSVIAPSKDWIRKNCEVTSEGEKWLQKIPGPYTLIFKIKNKNCIAKETNMGLESLGIRIPDYWTSKIAATADIPIITTSVNKTGEAYMTSIENIDSEIKAKVDFVIDEGEKIGKPSNIIHLEGEKVKIRERQKEKYTRVP